MNEGAKVILIDDDDDLRHALVQGLELEDIPVSAYSQPERALEGIDRTFAGVVVSDIRMPGTDGLTVMRKICEIDPALPVVLITGHGDVALAVEAMRDGAYDFIEKPFPTARLVSVITRALHQRRLVLENRVLRAELEHGGELESRIVGRNRIGDAARVGRGTAHEHVGVLEGRQRLQITLRVAGKRHDLRGRIDLARPEGNGDQLLGRRIFGDVDDEQLVAGVVEYDVGHLADRIARLVLDTHADQGTEGRIGIARLFGPGRARNIDGGAELRLRGHLAAQLIGFLLRERSSADHHDGPGNRQQAFPHLPLLRLFEVVRTPPLHWAYGGVRAPGGATYGRPQIRFQVRRRINNFSCEFLKARSGNKVSTRPTGMLPVHMQ